MEELSAKEIEKKTPAEVLRELSAVEVLVNPEDSKEFSDEVVQDAINYAEARAKLLQPDLYFLETDGGNTFVKIKEKATNKIVYYTEEPTEISELILLG